MATNDQYNPPQTATSSPFVNWISGDICATERCGCPLDLASNPECPDRYLETPERAFTVGTAVFRFLTQFVTVRCWPYDFNKPISVEWNATS